LKIFVIDASGHPFTRIAETAKTFKSVFPKWSPDGKNFYLLSWTMLMIYLLLIKIEQALQT